MNDYRITYTTEAGDSFDSTITERTEAAARKHFNAMNKGLGFTVSDIELIRENTCATKQQERDTLEAIKKMVAELGPQSYLATAFEGAFEDAENNIEDDAAYSMASRWESEKKTAESLREIIDDLQAVRKENEAEIKALTEELEAARRQALSDDDLCDVSQLVADKVLDLGKEVASAAERIVEAAGEPDSAEFQNAVKEHRAAKSHLAYYTALLSRVNTIRNAD